MAEFDYDDIADVYEDDLDCLSIEALVAELFGGDDDAV